VASSVTVVILVGLSGSVVVIILVDGFIVGGVFQAHDVGVFDLFVLAEGHLVTVLASLGLDKPQILGRKDLRERLLPSFRHASVLVVLR
jgi:hypothetical protein